MGRGFRVILRKYTFDSTAYNHRYHNRKRVSMQDMDAGQSTLIIFLTIELD